MFLNTLATGRRAVVSAGKASRDEQKANMIGSLKRVRCIEAAVA